MASRDGRSRRRGDSDAERLLEAVGDTIGASLDLDETLERISRLAIRGFADVCLTYLREGDDILRLAAFAATDPEVLAPTLVALSGYGQPSDHERSRAAGFAAHLVKPVNLAELRAAIAAPQSE